MNTAELRAKLLGGNIKPQKKAKKGLSTGSTLFNLALTGDPSWGFAPSCFYLLVGASRSGKTFLALNALAEATIHSSFAKHRLIYDAPERGARMDIAKFFGPILKKKLEHRYSSTVEDFYFGLDDDFAKDEPFILVLDSESSLTSEDELEKFQANKTAYRKGRDMAGSYGDGKAKKHSSNLRQVISKLEDSKSIVIMISQSRDNIGFGAQFNPNTRSGGKALTFYATSEAWFSVKKSIKKTVNDIPRKIGTILEVKVTKNRETGREPIVDLYHYPNLGFDDTGSIVNWLIEEKHWKKKGKKSSQVDSNEEKTKKSSGIIAPEFDFTGSIEKLIRKIEDEDCQEELKAIASQVWADIEAQCGVQRKPRYSQKEIIIERTT